MNSKVFLPALPGESPDGDGYFGAFGGLDGAREPESGGQDCKRS